MENAVKLCILCVCPYTQMCVYIYFNTKKGAANTAWKDIKQCMNFLFTYFEKIFLCLYNTVCSVHRLKTQEKQILNVGPFIESVLVTQMF